MSKKIHGTLEKQVNAVIYISESLCESVTIEDNEEIRELTDSLQIAVNKLKEFIITDKPLEEFTIPDKPANFVQPEVDYDGMHGYLMKE